MTIGCIKYSSDRNVSLRPRDDDDVEINLFRCDGAPSVRLLTIIVQHSGIGT